MKILFKNITEYTKENCDHFKEFHINKYAKKEMYKYILIAVIIVYLIISNIIYKNWILFLTVLIFGIFLYAFTKYRQIIINKLKKIFKRRECDKYKYKPTVNSIDKTISKESSVSVENSVIIYPNRKRNSIFKTKKLSTEYVFYFYENYMKIKNRKLSKKVWYYKFNKIFETDKFFFMYIDDKEPWFLEKDGFVIGNSEKFTEFIKKKCLFKYKNEE